MKTQKHIATLATFFACIGLLTMEAFLAYAIDTKQYPGFTCVKALGSGTPVESWGSIGNTSSTSPLYVFCPMVKDATSIQSGWVRVTDQHYTSHIRCALHSVYRSGSSVYQWTSGSVYSGGSNPNVQQLPFGGVGSNSLAHYYSFCEIPPTYGGNISYVHTYQIVEND